MVIAVLALQGAFAEHRHMLTRLGVDSFEIRSLDDFARPMDGLIIPGGESTTQAKLLHELHLFEPIRSAICAGLPVFGTCAGLILLASRLADGSMPHLATMDITARRNAYGRQLGSFSTTDHFQTIGNIPMTFIRAPYITTTGSNVDILATVNGRIVAARQQNQLACAFHPELTTDTRVHEYFLNMVKGRKG